MPAPRFAVLIPARFESTRLPGKMLAPVAGKPLIQHVLERAQRTPGEPPVIVLTDHDAIEAVVREAGGQVRRTRADHVSGTDRCAEGALALDVEVVVNVQGDEPLFAPEALAALARSVLEEGADIATLSHPFDTPAARDDPSKVKALLGAEGWAVGFQRAWPPAEAWAVRGIERVEHHLGIYAFRRERLLAFPALPPTEGERRERLEQLRALEHGWRIRVLPSPAPAFGVDTPQDLAALRERWGVPGDR